MAKTIRKNFPVEGMGCAACVARVQNTLKNVPGVADASVSLASNSARVDYDPQVVSAAGLQKAVQDAGYNLLVDEGSEAEEEADRRREDRYRALRRDAVLSLVLAALVMLVGMGFEPFPGKGVVLAVMAGVSVFWCGRRFLVTAFRQALHKSASMDTLVALSTSISYLFSLFNLLFPKVWTSQGLPARLYFESAAMIVAFILLGRLLEERAKHATTASVRALMGIQPKRPDIRPGDEVTVAPGGRIPADGAVVSGMSFVDESMMTGEPEAVPKAPGAKVYAGTMNLRGSFTMRAEKVGTETMLSAIIRMVRDAQGSKARIQHTVDKVAAVFVPVIIGISVLTLVAWLFLSPEDGLTRGLLAMVTVLVVACPCSLGLATPTALIAGIGNGASQGILIKDADSLEVARKVDTVVLDKTGTITEGHPEEGKTDAVKASSREAVQALQSMGIDVHMLSGDNPQRAGEIAAQVGITQVKASCMPEDKGSYIKMLKEQGRTVAMVGDGINDTAAMAYADLSVAMGGGTDIAMDTAMATIVSSDLRKIPSLIRLSRRASRIIKENLAWAFLYNLIAVPVATGLLFPSGGFVLDPMVAAAAMAASSVLVVTNSLRLRR